MSQENKTLEKEAFLDESIKIYPDADQASFYVANKIATIIKTKQSEGNLAVLGLATGSTPKGVYRELVRLHQHEGLSFQNVVTFNLDEYYPMHPVEEQSYVTFMKHNLFNHIDIPAHQIHIPDGTLSLDAIQAYCALYEQKILDFGGLDVQLLGIGRSGHIGFNEPGSVANSITRLVTLNDITRADASDDFGGPDKVPTQAITMGIQTIVQAKQIFLLALSERKAEIIQQAIKGEISPTVPATFLQQLKQVEYVLDQKAAALL